MIFSPPNLQVIAGGNIRPSRVVKISTAADDTVLESAAATSANIGIAQKGTRRAPGTGDDDGFAAVAGENLQVYGPSCVAPGQLGGTVASGDKVTSDGSGLLITTTSAGDVALGWALEGGVTGDIVRILVHPFILH